MSKKVQKSSLPAGFAFSTAEAAIKKPGRKDIALIHSEFPCTAAGVFTTNLVKAAPVRLCMRRIKSGRGQTIIVNSGNANACTGARGMKDAEEISSRLAGLLSLKPGLIYPCSTGVIGTPLPMQRIVPRLDKLASGLGGSSLDDVARAIMTTDTFPKLVRRRVKIGKRYGTVSGICKGAGMIAPNMATMLCFLLTDIAIGEKAIAEIMRDSVSKSFNRITIDGDMSTNDTVLFLANGAIGNAPITAKSAEFLPLKRAVGEITYELSRLVAKDGEGATKLVEVLVRGARDESDAEKAAFAVANSNLVKTAIYGNDANWGRIMCALGYSGVKIREEKTDIYFNKVKVVRSGLSNGKDQEAARLLKGAEELTITVDLHSGQASCKVLTCDFSEDYVRINAEYRT